ncbi:hypothetical protein BQ8482_250083 [Mesorhizobium delmotii]|uniref:Uncharacterized protein n=1 Tax=Mesorhizobium delmotii TaxID=1631247 RepID=A0A2P9AM34_9HYPH|nr:hypothetical protein BQ8482_250083 [Mesorhizobium delmotii]
MFGGARKMDQRHRCDPGVWCRTGGSPQAATEFSTVCRCTLTGSEVGGAWGVGMAIAGSCVWSLVWMQLTKAAVETAIVVEKNDPKALAAQIIGHLGDPGGRRNWGAREPRGSPISIRGKK